MPTIELSGVQKSYVAGQLAVRNLHLEVPDGSFTCLLGPSGCGKTTTLRMIAGLEQPDAGEIRVGDRVLDSVAQGRFVPPEKREMGFVFQSYALWPHLTVRRNVDFGLRLRKCSRPERERRVAEAMRALHIEEYADRYPAQLSGGQQQRVSLARMLAVSPDVLLLDEPLSNLDAALRLEMRTELKRLHAELGHTVVFVTHDQLEAMTMATHIAVMKDGELQQLAAPMEIYERPANTFVAEFVGSPPMCMLDRETAPGAAAIWDFVAATDPELAVQAGTIGIRPESIMLAADHLAVPEGCLAFPVTVTAVLPTGSTWIVSLDGPGGEMFAVTSTPPVGGVGDEVVAWVPRERLHVFDDAGVRLTARHERVAGDEPVEAIR
ncbi:ABC transporter ATP-binding protein [Nocardioides sp. YIM 152315]|uniref:ABC transporter ATP-binding protein n=1 Tax=Nocardioides sp. YIM 152315 TaxID=3031760 RepID=UPI0023DBDCFA|nr:ABC transporter ATP-binding protein [Nocardioides sp. YIM 152315]MDF1605480.1 ABC transporter ATP-binding protein [Nocardioides sp. YIM 152315]